MDMPKNWIDLVRQFLFERGYDQLYYINTVYPECNPRNDFLEIKPKIGDERTDNLSAFSIDRNGTIKDCNRFIIYNNELNRNPFSYGLNILLSILQKEYLNYFFKHQIDNLDSRLLGKKLKFSCNNGIVFNFFEESLVWRGLEDDNSTNYVEAKFLEIGQLLYTRDCWYKIINIECS